MSGVTADVDMKPADGGVHITLKVKGQDGNKVYFRIKRSTQLKKLMTAYCDHRQTGDINSIAFLFDGRRLRAEKTPEELEMEEGAEIDAMLHLAPGPLDKDWSRLPPRSTAQHSTRNSSADRALRRRRRSNRGMSGVTANMDMKPADGGVHITLKVKGQDGNKVYLHIKRSTQLKKLMTAYCEHRQTGDINSIAFLFDGRRLRAEQTPEELEMEEGAEIDAMLHPDWRVHASSLEESCRSLNGLHLVLE